MENIVVVPVKYEDQFLWCVFERATDQVINSFFFEDDALEYARFVRQGGGFAGFTPTFMTNSVNLNQDINTEFAFRS